MSKKVKLYNQKAEVVGELELASNIFDVKMNEALVHQAMVAQNANERQVLAHTKGRSEVRGGGKKPWKQKGTGRARVGSSRSPIWKGGGVTFGPTKDRNFKKDINKKMKQKALFCILSDKLKNDAIVVMDKIDIAEYKTKLMNKVIVNFETNIWKEGMVSDNNEKGESKVKAKKRSVLVINKNNTTEAKGSTKNLVGVELINSENIDIVNLLKFRKLIVTQDAIKALEERYSKDS